MSGNPGSFHPIIPNGYPQDDIPIGDTQKGYALSGKIMLSAIVILFAVVIFMVVLHLYARWYLLRARRRSLHRSRRTHVVFYVDPNNPSATIAVPASGLDPSVLSSLPVFVYSSKTHPDALECAVCLSEFEDNEKGRLLPKCSHRFHIDCIDMWFHSHSSCPLCRSPVEPGLAPETAMEMVVSVGEPVETGAGGGSSSGLCATCRHEEEDIGRSRPSSSAGTSSYGAQRKPLEFVGVSIEVPRRNMSFGRSDDESGIDSPSSQAFKSPGSRLLSLKRILGRGLSPSGRATSFSSVTEPDMERGIDETQPTQTR